jgi:hypothetical protein
MSAGTETNPIGTMERLRRCESVTVLSPLPNGWRLHHLGQERPTSFWIAQIAYDGEENPEFDNITFVSRTGLTAASAYAEAIAAITPMIRPEQEGVK